MAEQSKDQDPFYIYAHSCLADAQMRVLKNADTFGVFDKRGTIRPLGFEDHGLFHHGTRYLSQSDVRLENGQIPLLLSSNVKEDNDFLVVDLTNPDFWDRSGTFVARGTIHFVRTMCLWTGQLFEEFRISHYGHQRVEFGLVFSFDADFVDIFEVRGTKRDRRGTRFEPEFEDHTLVFGYEGLDKKIRKMKIHSDPSPDSATQRTFTFNIALDSQEEKRIEIIASCILQEEPFEKMSLQDAFRSNRAAYERFRSGICSVETSNEQFNDWICQSRADIHMLVTQTEHGLYPYAGIPWFSTIFGRDGLITAFETLWFYPDLARGVLKYLAHTQAKKEMPERDAEPGKILHEFRRGEMAHMGEIPFGLYYGTVDATPLFIVLAGAYYERTGDKKFLEDLWPNIEAGLQWIERYGDADGDGFVEYVCRAERGLPNQGWKDSDDSIFHADNSPASSPLALCEVQSYVYEAKLKASAIARVLGRKRTAVSLRKAAEQLQKKFHAAYWQEPIGLFAAALDGDKRPCAIRTSNAGQCLFGGIAGEEQAKRVAAELMKPDFFSGWGVRTLAVSEARYNPMSYHNGSVWPHDNALIAYGLARYGLKKEAVRVMTGLFDASIFVELHRLPELFCGFRRRKGEGPTLYPVACDPQAWAAGSVFLFLQACLGMTIRADERKIFFDRPALPDYLDKIRIQGLEIAGATLDLTCQRYQNSVSINLKHKSGPVDIITTK